MIETKRLRIYVASREEMESFISLQTIDALKDAYTEMLNGYLEYPNERIWYAIWMIELKDGTHIGELCFKGIDEFGSTEIGYGIDNNYQNFGYATEAVTAVTSWALEQNVIESVTAEVENENIASKRVLEKSGFISTRKFGKEGLIYRKEK